ncbi:uncharacterized protein LOC131994706 [Stomoxys calcitrans]|uniref:uncharacterized protein LOC131994706 n=1 Tax=Stomoxys calcitrans TaxID=35570 RepID=UPI0027E21EB4|nr:uncharacterized protein LOC131994706 [Stomoxys calcitrans]
MPMYFASCDSRRVTPSKDESLNPGILYLRKKSTSSVFSGFKKCYLKDLGNDVVSLHIHVELHQLPINNITTNGQLFHQGNIFRPYMYNTTVNLCEFFQYPKRQMFWKIIFDNFIMPFSNINHTCPYDHDIIMDNATLKAEAFRLIPFPNNDYMVQLKFAAYNVYRASVKIYFKIF